MDVELIANVVTIVGVPIAIVAGTLAYKQLQASEAATETQLILAVDEAFARFETLREAMSRDRVAGHNAHSEAISVTKWMRYLYLWERLGLLIDRGVLAGSTAASFYSERFRKLLANEHVRGILDRQLKADPGAWKNLLVLWKEFAAATARKPEAERIEAPPRA